jgi:chorismate mutase
VNVEANGRGGLPERRGVKAGVPGAVLGLALCAPRKYDVRVSAPEIEALRVAIDDVDRKILELMTERVRLVLAIGDIKRTHQMAVYDPERERRVLDRLASQAAPPLDPTTVRRVFERLIDEMRRLEQHHVSQH